MKLRPLLRLLRLPALFTTFPDVLAGYAIVRQGEVYPWELTGLLTASGLLYLSGMVFNDYFDIEQDRIERPERPIPSGAISRKQAGLIGLGLLLGGLIVATTISLIALIVGATLAGAILTYDAGGKRSSFGPIIMGCCRGVNVMLGAACVASFSDWTLEPALLTSAIMVLYVCGITYFARSEARESPAAPLTIGLILAVSALLCWGALSAVLSEDAAFNIVLVMLLLIAFQVLRKGIPAIRSREPQDVQQTVRVMLLTIPMLEAIAIIAHGGDEAIPLAIAAALMMIPGQIISRYISMT